MTSSHFQFRAARAWRWSMLALAALAIGAGVAWVLTLLDRGEARMAWLALLTLPLGWWAGRVGRDPGGVLRDEGGYWWLETPADATRPVVGSLSVAFDFGDWMLLRFEAEGAHLPRWLVPSHADMPDAWTAFRRAVYSPRPTPAGRSAQAPADPPA